jgi:hypothetical protein
VQNLTSCKVTRLHTNIIDKLIKLLTIYKIKRLFKGGKMKRILIGLIALSLLIIAGCSSDDEIVVQLSDEEVAQICDNYEPSEESTSPELAPSATEPSLQILTIEGTGTMITASAKDCCKCKGANCECCPTSACKQRGSCA